MSKYTLVLFRPGMSVVGGRDIQISGNHHSEERNVMLGARELYRDAALGVPGHPARISPAPASKRHPALDWLIGVAAAFLGVAALGVLAYGLSLH
jgi:hypothetical protein